MSDNSYQVVSFLRNVLDENNQQTTKQPPTKTKTNKKPQARKKQLYDSKNQEIANGYFCQIPVDLHCFTAHKIATAGRSLFYA